MKKAELFKRVLAGSLGLTLAFSSVPAMAAETQQPEGVVEAVDAETPEEPEAGLQADEAQPEAGLQADEAQPEEAVAEPEALPEEVAAPQLEAVGVDGDITGGDDTTVDDGTTGDGDTTVDDGTGDEEIEAPAPEASITNQSIVPEEWDDEINLYLTYSDTNCDYTELSVTAASTRSVVYSSGYCYSGKYIYTSDFYDAKTKAWGLVAGETYTFTLKPYNYEGTAGKAVTLTWKAPVVDAVNSLAVKEMTSEGIVFSHTAVSAGTSVRYEYSADKSFDEKKSEVFTSSYSDTIGYGNLKPGVTYYVRAYATRYGMKGAYSNVVSVKAPVAEVTGITAQIAAKAVTLTMRTSFGDRTGFQIYRKQGSGKYQYVTTVASRRYKDTGLKTNTKYTYRVRPYYYNTDSKKYTYGSYFYKNIETGTAFMNLRAQVSGKNAVKLTWKKISSAAGYDVYRAVGTSVSTTYKSDEGLSEFSKYELVKSLSKKKVSYTDKKLNAGSYSYCVRAYKLVNKKKVYFTEDSDSTTVKAAFSVGSSVDIYKEAQSPKTGKVSIAWDAVPQAKGYRIEKYDETKSEWVTYKTLTSSKKSYTLPASPLGTTVKYRVRAYSGNKYSHPGEVSVIGHIAAVTGVKAAATANGINISWKPVSGASYYRVYRTVDPLATYDADTKTYSYDGYDEAIGIKAFKDAEVTDNYYYTLLGNSAKKVELDRVTANKQAYHSPYETYDPNDEYAYVDTTRIAGTSVIDYAYDYHRPVYDDQGKATSEDVTSYGPEGDVTYHYYVIAYKEIKVGNDYITASSYGDSKSASAKITATAVNAKTPTIKKVKAGKKSATLTIKKMTGAKMYLIYRSTSKSKGYTLVGSTTKTSYKDSKLTSKKKYYYKVKAVYKDGLGADKLSSLSKVKSATAK